MRRPGRRWLWVGLALLALLGVVPLRLATLDAATVQREVERYLSDALGVEVRGRTVHMALGLRAALSADDLRVGNLPGRPSPYLLEAQEAELGLRLWPLLQGRVDVDEVTLRRATLRLEPSGEPAAPLPDADWAALEEGPPGSRLHVAVHEVRAEDLVVLVGAPDDARRIVFHEIRQVSTDPREARRVRLRGELDGRDFRLEGLVGPPGALLDPGQPFPVKLEGNALGARWKMDATLGPAHPLADVALDALEMRIPGVRVEASGRVADLRALRGIDLAVRAAAERRVLRPWLGDEATLAELALDGTLRDEAGGARLGFHGSLAARGPAGAAETLALDASAPLASLRAGEDVAVQADVSAPQGLAPLGTLLGRSLPDVAPVSWKGRLGRRAAGLAADGSLHAGASDLRVEASWQRAAGGRGELKATLEGGDVRLEDLGVPHGFLAPGWAGEGRGRSLERADLETLRGFDADLALDARRVLGHEGPLVEGVHLEARLHDGVLDVRYRRDPSLGDLGFRFAADLRGQEPVLELRVEARRLDVHVPAAELYGDPRFEGVLDLDAELAGRGLTLDRLAPTLEGRIRVTGRDGTFAREYARAFIRDIFVRILESGSQRPPERFRCAKADLRVHDGVVHADELWMNLSGVHLVGSGSLDLPGRSWNLLIRPQVYGPGLIGGGVSVAVSGPIERPEFRARPLSIPFNVGETLAKRVLQPLDRALRPLTGDQDPCLALDEPAESSPPRRGVLRRR